MKKGFTLIELLVVISIIGVLVAVAISSYGNAQIKSRDARRRGDMKTIQTTMEQYYATTGNSSYPLDLSTAFSPHIAPTDPKASPYEQYTTPTLTTSNYCICAKLEETTKGNSDALCGWVATGTHYCVSNQQ